MGTNVVVAILGCRHGAGSRVGVGVGHQRAAAGVVEIVQGPRTVTQCLTEKQIAREKPPTFTRIWEIGSQVGKVHFDLFDKHPVYQCLSILILDIK